MLIFLSEQSEKVELKPQNVVTSQVKQGWREKKGDPFFKPTRFSLSALFIPVQPTLESVRSFRTKGKAT